MFFRGVSETHQMMVRELEGGGAGDLGGGNNGGQGGNGNGNDPNGVAGPSGPVGDVSPIGNAEPYGGPGNFSNSSGSDVGQATGGTGDDPLQAMVAAAQSGGLAEFTTPTAYAGNLWWVSQTPAGAVMNDWAPDGSLVQIPLYQS